MAINYPILGAFIPAEIPYELDDTTVQLLDLTNPAAEFPVTPVVSGASATGTRPTTAGENKVSRHGWLKDNSQSVPSDVDAANVTPTIDEQTFRLVSPGGQPLLIAGKEIRITKVVAIPYRWERAGDANPRQTFVLVCYSGPDAG
jgi:hypothetical protein